MEVECSSETFVNLELGLHTPQHMSSQSALSERQTQLYKYVSYIWNQTPFACAAESDEFPYVIIYTRNKPTQTETCSPNPRVQVCGLRGRLYSKHFNFQRYAVKTQLQHNFDSRFPRQNGKSLNDPTANKTHYIKILSILFCNRLLKINFQNYNKCFKIIYKTDVEANYACSP